MDSIGLNSDLVIHGRRFHVQTTLNRESGELSAMVFEDGRLVEQVRRKVSGAISSTEAQAQVASLHREASEAVRSLFELCDKLRGIDHAASHHRMGWLFLRRGFLAEARREFELAIALDDSVPEYHKSLGEVVMAQGRPREAVDCFRRGLQAGPDYPDLHRALACAYWALGKRQEAVLHLRQAIALNPSYGAALLDLATLLLETLTSHSARPTRGGVDEIAHLARKALQCQGGEPEHLSQALSALQEDRLAQALELMRVAREVEGPSAEHVKEELLLRLMVGRGAQDGETVDRLVGELERLTARNAGYADLHNSLGVAYLIQGRNYLLRAAQQFKEALHINPRFRTAKRNLRLVENDGRGLLILLRTLLK